MGKSKCVAKVLDGVARVVLGPKSGRGTEPRDPREITEGPQGGGQ